MANLVRDLEQVLSQEPTPTAANEQFVRLRDFLKDMQDRGLVVKKGYDLPLVDTIGRTAYRRDL